MKLMTRKQVAELFQVTPKTIDNWRGKGFLPAVEVGGVVRFRVTDVEAVLTSKTSEK